MGTCYSCKSADPNTYNTVSMATDNKSVKRIGPYTRSFANGNIVNNTKGSAASHAFGFKKKNPVTIQSSDRTNSLVQKYENISLDSNESKRKLPLKNNSSVVAPVATNIPRIGYRSNPLGKSQPSNKNCKTLTNDSCETVRNAEKVNNNVPSQTTNANINKSSAPLSNIQEPIDNQTYANHLKKSEILKKQFLGSAFSIGKSQNSDSLCKSIPSQKVIPPSKVKSGSQNSLYEKHNVNRHSYSGTTSNFKSGINGAKIIYSSQQSLNSNCKSESQSKIPYTKFSSAQNSGLPRPNSLKHENAKGTTNESYITISYKAPSRFMSANANLRTKPQRCLDIPVKSEETSQDEAVMQTSADNLPDDNFANLKHSVGNFTSDADSGLGISMKSSFDTEFRNGETSNLADIDQIEALSRKNTPPSNLGPPGSGDDVSDMVDGHSWAKPSAESDLELIDKKIGTIVSDRSEDLSANETLVGKVTPNSSEVADPPAMFPLKDTKIASNERNEQIKRKSESKSLRDSFSSSKSSERTGTFSPTSDIESRNDFLIDDEIADQPCLIVLNDSEKTNLMAQSCMEAPPEEHETMVTKDDSFTKEHVSKPNLRVRRSLSLKYSDKQSPSHPATLSVIASHRQSLGSTMSSCSSINSDDLMMDFDIDSACADFDTEEGYTKMLKGRHSRHNSSGSTLDELNQLVDSQKETSLVRQRLASIRNRSRTASSPEMTQSLTEMSRHRSHSTPLKPPRPMRILSENESSSHGVIKLDPSFYRSCCQDVTSIKTMVFRLKRILHDADTLNPFEANNWKNSMYQRVASFETPHGLSTCQEDDAEHAARAENLIQVNADLRRQIVFLEQQSAEKDRTIKLLQQQMTKYSIGINKEEKVEQCNAATQTVKMKSTTSMDGISPTTVSNSRGRSATECQHTSNIVKGAFEAKQAVPQKDSKAPVRSASASSILQNPPVSNGNTHRNPKITCHEATVESSSSEYDLQKQNHSRLRSGAFSNVKRSSYSNNSLVPTKKSEDEPNSGPNTKPSSSKSELSLGFSRNSFTRNSGRFLSFFKLKRNTSSDA